MLLVGLFVDVSRARSLLANRASIEFSNFTPWSQTSSIGKPMNRGMKPMDRTSPTIVMIKLHIPVGNR